MNKWKILSADPKHVGALTKGTDLSPFCAEVLAARGITTAEEAAAFLGAEGELSDPFLLSDMLAAVGRIRQAIANEEPIAVYGDYDCDGVMATVMLCSYLECAGADICYYIPAREGEGYGMNPKAVHVLKKRGVRLIITVDNGITALEEAKLIAELGMDLIITDHHQPLDELPKALAVINPHRRDDPSPFKPLCGAGVALKLICALEDGDYDTALEQFGDLAAIATIGDVMPMIGENRILVRRGLELLANTENPGLLALMDACGLSPEKLSATAVAFTLVPRINAAGRFGSAQDAAELFRCEDEEEAAQMAQSLCKLNTERQECERDVLAQALAAIVENPALLRARVLLVHGEGWHQGVIGIVAARLCERFGKPVIVLSVVDGIAHGSARSVGGFSLHQALCACQDLLVRFGGHAKAAGLTVTEANLELLRDRLEEYARANFAVMPVPEITVDKVIGAGELTVENVQALQILEPFGEGNPRPVFAILGAALERITPLKDGKYISLLLRHGGQQIRAVSFLIAAADFTYPVGAKLDILCDVERNEYNGKISVSVKIRELRPSGFSQEKYFSAKAVYERISRGEGFDPALEARIVPTREDAARAYKLLSESPKAMDVLYQELAPQDMPYVKLRLALDILGEFQLVEISAANDTVRKLPAAQKADFANSKILAELQKPATFA